MSVLLCIVPLWTLDLTTLCLLAYTAAPRVPTTQSNHMSVCSFPQLSASPSWLRSPQEDLHPWCLACPLSFKKKWGTEWTKCIQFHALEKEMATRSSVLAWRIPGTAEPGGLPSLGSHRVTWLKRLSSSSSSSFSQMLLLLTSLYFFKQWWCWERLKAGEEGVTEDEMVGWHH